MMNSPVSSAAASKGGWNDESARAMAGRRPQSSDHCGVWVEFFLRYHLSENGIAFDYTTANDKTFERHQRILSQWLHPPRFYFTSMGFIVTVEI
jgi:hypothetical protein